MRFREAGARCWIEGNEKARLSVNVQVSLLKELINYQSIPLFPLDLLVVVQEFGNAFFGKGMVEHILQNSIWHRGDVRSYKG